MNQKTAKKSVRFPIGDVILEQIELIPDKTLYGRNQKRELWYTNDHFTTMKMLSQSIAITRMAMSSSSRTRTKRGRCNPYASSCMGLYTQQQKDEKQARIHKARWAVFIEQERQWLEEEVEGTTTDADMLSDTYFVMTRRCSVDAVNNATYLYKELYENRKQEDNKSNNNRRSLSPLVGLSSRRSSRPTTLSNDRRPTITRTPRIARRHKIQPVKRTRST